MTLTPSEHRALAAGLLDTHRAGLIEALRHLDAADEMVAHLQTTMAVSAIDDARSMLADHARLDYPEVCA